MHLVTINNKNKQIFCRFTFICFLLITSFLFLLPVNAAEAIDDVQKCTSDSNGYVVVSYEKIVKASCNCGAVVDDDGNPIPHTEGETFPCTEGWKWYRKSAFDACNTSGSSSTYPTLLDSGLYTIDIHGKAFGLVWSIVEALTDPILAIGYLLVILYFILNLIDGAGRETLNAEFVLKKTILLFVSILLITNITSILTACIDFSNSIIHLFSSTTSGPAFSEVGNAQTEALKVLYDKCKSAGFGTCIGMMISGLNFITGIINLITTLVIWLTVYSRYIEAGVRAIYAPIGMANIFDGGLNSSGMKYFKKFLAVCLQGALMVACVNVASAIDLAISGTTFNLGLVLPLVLMAVVLKSRKWTNDLLGV